MSTIAGAEVVGGELCRDNKIETTINGKDNQEERVDLRFDILFDKINDGADSNLFKPYDRQDLIRFYNEALEKRQNLRGINKTLNHRLLTNINKNKLSIIANSTNMHPSIANVTNEAIQQYNDHLKEYSGHRAELDELNKSFAYKTEMISMELSQLQHEHDDVERGVKDTLNIIIDGLTSSKPFSKSHKSLIDELIDSEMTLGMEMSEVQLENLKLREKYANLKEALQASNQKMTGCHLIDYEQLTAENQSLQEKIDDRMKEVQKLEEKTNQEVTGALHIDEKLNGIDDELEVYEEEVRALDDRLRELKQELNGKRIGKDALGREAASEQNRCVSLLFASQKVLGDFRRLAAENALVLDNYETKLTE